ncbi:MAG: flavodoxin family protein, partial [Dehalococcoidia bacterium]|nr:flavodoxin family protein [Dehalococcoidia bacterium]
MKINILGVCGSPIKRGNTEIFLRETLKVAGEMEGVETNIVLLSGKDIRDCQHCNWCITKQEEGNFCSQKDGMSEIYPLMLQADGLLLASPVYFGRLSGYLANFVDRLRVFMHGNYYSQKLKDKVGGALAVAWLRHEGLETTLLSINYAFWRLGMLTVKGAPAVSSLGGTGKFIPGDKHLVLKDECGLKSARELAGRMVEIIRMI